MKNGIEKRGATVNMDNSSHKIQSGRKYIFFSIIFLTIIFILVAYGVYVAYLKDYVTLGCLLVIPYGWIVSGVADNLKKKLMLNGIDKKSWVVYLLNTVRIIWFMQFLLILAIAIIVIIFWAIYGPFIGEWKSTILVGCTVIIIIIREYLKTNRKRD